VRKENTPDKYNTSKCWDLYGLYEFDAEEIKRIQINTLINTKILNKSNNIDYDLSPLSHPITFNRLLKSR